MGRRKVDPISRRLLMEGVHPVWVPGRQVWRYRARYAYVDAAGGRRFTGRTFDAAAEAEAWLADRQAELRRGTHADPSTLTVAAYFERWYRRKKAGWGGSRQHSVRWTWDKHLAPRVGALRLRDVTRERCQVAVDALTAEGLKGQTVRLYMVILTSLFRDAVREGIVPTNPAADLDYPKPEPAPRVIWSPLQMRRFLAATADDPHGALWAFLIATGCRIGEALAVQWNDVDLDAGTVLIHRTTTVTAEGKATIRTGTKTRHAGRTVPLEPWMVDRLRAHAATRHADSLLVFHADGAPQAVLAVRTAWKRRIGELKLPPIRLHDVRHSVATAMVAAGISERIVQEVLGHADIRTTLALYAHVDVRMQRQGTSVMSELLGMASSATTPEPKRAER